MDKDIINIPEKQKINVVLSLIQQARTQKRMRALSAYYLLKTKFQNSCIYNYRSRMQALAASLNVCEKTLYNYFHHLRRMGLVYDFSGHLMLTSTRKLKEAAGERKKYKITVSENETIETIEARLFGKLAEKHIKKIAFHKKIKLFAQRRDQSKKTGDENAQEFSLSVRNFMKLFNLSQEKTRKVLKLLNDNDVMRTRKRNAKVLDYGSVPPLKYSKEFPGHFFKKDGFLFVLFGSLRELLEYPVNDKPVTLRQYVNYCKTVYCKKHYDSKKT